MKEIFDFLSKNKFGSLATCTENQPDNRPIECVFTSEKGLFFYTTKGKDLAEQLDQNKNVCFSATDSEYSYVKIKGPVSMSNEKEDQFRILENSKFAKQVFANDNLSSMLVFYMPHGTGMLHQHGNNKPICHEF